MKFKKGCLIEVLTRENHPYESWYPAEMMSVDDGNYIVKYDLIMDQKGEHLLERVPIEHVRPRPKHGKKKTWMVGDIAEVFDNHCWRIGKVAKVLKNDSFVIRLFGSIQLKEFHKSSLRIQQTWHNNKWLIVGKDGYNVQICSNHNSRCSQRLKGLRRVVKGERHSGVQNGRECIKRALSHQDEAARRGKQVLMGEMISHP
ncbi:Agenet-like domain [Dillenia turbinata]|uniref:Agenet-like domain n=1 Tax=Dillenia turbinata TaxID=194707 RepID=A0AAN8VXG6_9MAGN